MGNFQNKQRALHKELYHNKEYERMESLNTQIRCHKKIFQEFT
jgi:hypothetical protein